MGQITTESEINQLNISAINHENCDPWCKECAPSCIIESTSGNSEIDNFIKDTIYNAKCLMSLEWVPFNRFKNIKQVGEGGFAKVYSAGPAENSKGSWKKLEHVPKIVALKRLNG